MALSTQPKLHTNGILRILVGATVLEVVTEDGDVKIDGLGRRLNESVRVVRRGRIMGTGYGERRFPSVGFTEKIMSMTALAAPGSIRDMVCGQGPYTALTSTLGAGQVFTVDVEYTAKDNSGSPDDVLYMNDVDFNSYGFAEGEPDTFSNVGAILGPILLNGVTIAAEISAGGA